MAGREARASPDEALTRRDALRSGLSCAAWLAVAQSLMPRALRAAFARRTHGRVVAAEPFGRLEEVAPGTWALISTPFGGDRTTVANGGIVASTRAVVVIEGLFTPGGATWLASQAKALTGRWPTHVVVTHHHADHANGAGAYRDCGPGCSAPRLHATPAVRAALAQRTPAPDAALAAALADAVLVDALAPTTLDLGGRTVRLVPTSGHTESDLVVEVPDAQVTFAGDLAWNGVFPNYVDARPSRWTSSAAVLPSDPRMRTVPGHGAVMDAAAVSNWRALLAEVERAARRAHAAGTPADDAARAWAIPASLGEWMLFGPAFLPRAFTAWYRELDAPR
jgi:glyoxylase-like metal-dependent hydrolase (beta-lactamase superfamily II)